MERLTVAIETEGAGKIIWELPDSFDEHLAVLIQKDQGTRELEQTAAEVLRHT